jgi:hypothetical protein
MACMPLEEFFLCPLAIACLFTSGCLFPFPAAAEEPVNVAAYLAPYIRDDSS